MPAQPFFSYIMARTS